MFLSIFNDLQYPFIFKYQVDKDKYVKFFIPIHQTNLFNIGLPVKSYYTAHSGGGGLEKHWVSMAKFPSFCNSASN